jgi:hypothetical protein
MPNLRLGFARNISVGSNQDLRAYIADSAKSGDTITLGTGHFYFGASIQIAKKNNLWIRGAGKGSTVLHPADSVAFAFFVGDSVTSLTISDLTVQGTAPLSGNTYGIGMSAFTRGSSSLYFLRLELLELGVGIGIGGQGCDDVTIFDNTIVGIRSRYNASTNSTSGSGYGVANQNCSHVRIAENYLEEVERHSVYQAVSSGPVTIEHNFILNHMKTGTIQRSPNLVAITVTNTQNASVSFNTIVNPYSDAISVEYENDGRGGSTSNPQLIGNTIIGARASDLFVTYPGTIDVWGNKYYHRGSIGWTASPSVRVDGAAYPNGYTLRAPSTRWANTQMLDAQAPGSANFFVLQNGVIHEALKSYQSAPDSWNYTGYTGPYSNVQALSAGNANAYAMIANTLYAFSPGTPSWSSRTSPTNWSGFEAMTFTGNQLYIVQSGTLHHVDPVNFSYTSPAPRSGWQNTQALTGFKGRLFLIQNDCTHEVSTSTLWYTRYWC